MFLRVHQEGLRQDNKTLAVSSQTKPLLSTNMAIWIYGIIVVALTIISYSRTIFFTQLCIKISQNLHKTMFHQMLTAEMSFFDTNPRGRILNRFSSDIGAVDERLPNFLLTTVQVIQVMTCEGCYCENNQGPIFCCFIANTLQM